jgi:hypothetical protein
MEKLYNKKVEFFYFLSGNYQVIMSFSILNLKLIIIFLLYQTPNTQESYKITIQLTINHPGRKI